MVERVAPSVLLTRREGLESLEEPKGRRVAETVDLLRRRSRLIADRITVGECAIACVAYTLADGKAKRQRVIGNIGELELPPRSLALRQYC